MDQYLLLPRPESFDLAKSLLTLGEIPSGTCQNIQLGTKPIDIFVVKFKEEVRLMLHFHATGWVQKIDSIAGRDL